MRAVRFSVRTKILSGFVLLFILFISVLVFNLVQMRQVQLHLSIVQQGYLPLTKVVARVENTQQGMERYLDPDRLIARESVPTSVYLSLAVFHLGRIEESLRSGRERLGNALRMPGVAAEGRALALIDDQYTRIEDEFERYSGLFREVLQHLEAGRGEAARKQVPLLRDQMVRFSRAVRDLGEVLDRRVEGAVDLTRERQDRAEGMTTGLSLAAVLFGLVMIFVTHLVLRPIGRLTEGVKRIGGGDYGQRVAIEAEDEIGTLAREFNAMAANLEERDLSLKQSRTDLEHAYEDMARAHAELQTLSLYHENILHSIEVGLLVCDREGRLTTVNPAACQLWSIAPDAVLGHGLEAIPGLAALANVPEEVLATGRQARHEALEVRAPDDATHLIDFTFVPLLDELGQARGVIVLAEDVTERTRTKQRLIQSERLALIGKLSAQVTHEIRNPLNALGLNAELLGDELDHLDPDHASDAWQTLQSVSREIDRLTEVTESYLRLARLPTPVLERERIAEIVESLLRFVREELASQGIDVKLDLEDGLPELLLDENQIRQALLNLLRNAAEASGPGGHIRVKVARDQQGVAVVIADDGAGIEPTILSRIFDPFYSTKVTGTGLGLPITQQIVEEHGGRISCSSEPEVGTIFRVWLPAS